MDIPDLRPPTQDPWPPFTHHPPISSEGVRGARSWTGLTFGLVQGYRPMTLDLHVPTDAAGPVPVVVWIHGGGWTEGYRRYVPLQWPQQVLFDKIVAAGMAVATVDYRLLAEAPLPAGVHDCVAAVRYLRRYADQLGLAPDRLGIWGESAGAHLASLVAFVGSQRDPNARLLGRVGVGEGRLDVAASVLFYGPAHLRWIMDEVAGDDVRGALGGDLTLAEDLSPVNQVHHDIAPVLLMHGRDDAMVPASESVILHDALLAAGVDSTLEITDGADHCFIGAPIEPHLDRAIDFLGRHLES